jgi:8-oxo-dGTP pyrophosphatase MutT (NUDIX family)
MSERQVRDDQLPKGAGTAREITTPIRAASTIVLRGDPFEVLLMRRSDRSSFVPGAWVFPGGTLEDQDRELAGRIGANDESTMLRICGVRELLEESGLWFGSPAADADRLRAALLAGQPALASFAAELPPLIDRLVLTSRWITPEGIPKRFDTWFFLVEASGEREAVADLHEGVELLWLTPAAALERHHAGSLPMVFPTIRNLEELRGWNSSAALLAARRSAQVRPVRPVLTVRNGRTTITVPGEE